jgi:hypothetical protein
MESQLDSRPTHGVDPQCTARVLIHLVISGPEANRPNTTPEKFWRKIRRPPCGVTRRGKQFLPLTPSTVDRPRRFCREGGVLNDGRDASSYSIKIKVRNSWGPRALANSVWTRHRALQTLANSAWKRHRPTKIVIRASSTHFTQASAAKMGCARDPSQITCSRDSRGPPRGLWDVDMRLTGASLTLCGEAGSSREDSGRVTNPRK